MALSGKSFLIISALTVWPVALSAQDIIGTEERVSIIEHIEAGGNTIVQPAGLERLLIRASEQALPVSDIEDKAATAVKGKVAGYRVQVFSDNNTRTAKNEARSKSRNISARFPQYRTYVMYNSPYWRLKVGDFRTQHEAEEAADEIRQAFPSYSKEIRVVRDRISVNN